MAHLLSRLWVHFRRRCGEQSRCGMEGEEQFNAENNLSVICRSHQLVMEGYKWMFNNQLVDVWSAPNYCYRCGNIASIMEVDEYLQTVFKTFDAAPQNERKEPSKNLPPDYFL